MEPTVYQAPIRYGWQYCAANGEIQETVPFSGALNLPQGLEHRAISFLDRLQLPDALTQES